MGSEVRGECGPAGVGVSGRCFRQVEPGVEAEMQGRGQCLSEAARRPTWWKRKGTRRFTLISALHRPMLSLQEMGSH